MKTLEQGSQKIKKLCDIIKNDTIEPAKKEAEGIIADAKIRAQEIVAAAETQAKTIHEEAKASVEQERNVFNSTLVQASKLSFESLKQEIQNKLFNQELYHLIEKNTSDPAIIAKLVEAIIKALEKDGLAVNLSAIVPKTVSEKQLNALLGEHILSTLKERSVVLGDFTGGAKVKMHDKNITLEISDKSLLELFASYATSFRKFIFGS